MKIFDLEKRYGEFALQINQMQITEEGIYGLIGANGCGKSTLLKLIAGIETMDKGRIDYCGTDMRDVTMVASAPYMLHDTVYNNLLYPLKIRGRRPDRSLIDQYLETAGLQDKRKSYAPALSSGQRQKLGLIRAMIFSPAVLLIDEALSGMDIEGAAVMEEMLRTRQQQSHAKYLMVSHQLSRIQRMCSHVFFLHQGKLCWEGGTGELFDAPSDPYLGNFLKTEIVRQGCQKDGTSDG